MENVHINLDVGIMLKHFQKGKFVQIPPDRCGINEANSNKLISVTLLEFLLFFRKSDVFVADPPQAEESFLGGYCGENPALWKISTSPCGCWCNVLNEKPSALRLKDSGQRQLFCSMSMVSQQIFQWLLKEFVSHVILKKIQSVEYCLF